MQHASRYASATIPARAVLGHLAVDFLLRSRSRWERGYERQHVADGRALARYCAHRHLDVTVEIVDRFLEVDTSTLQPSAYNHLTIHREKSSSFVPPPPGLLVPSLAWS
jgi:hypothetical protein